MLVSVGQEDCTWGSCDKHRHKNNEMIRDLLHKTNIIMKILYGNACEKNVSL